jgi:D-alanyl-D-alanine carboxypeptidase
MILAADLVHDPNTVLKYSNLGFGLLGQIIEVVSRQPYTDFISRSIIEALELTQTYADYTMKITEPVATAYGLEYRHHRTSLEPRLPTESLAAAIGIYATATDMCRFAAAQFFGNERLISDVSKREMQRSQVTAISGQDAGMSFGLGMEIMQIGSRRVVGHSGHLAGYTTITLFDPCEKIAVSVMVNCKDAPVVQMIRGIFEALDFFSTNACEPTSADRDRFNARLYSSTVVVQVVATHARIVGIDPDDWEPFTWSDELEEIDATTLRVSSQDSVFTGRERIRYMFDIDGALRAVNYAGSMLSPEAKYHQLMVASIDEHGKG